MSTSASWNPLDQKSRQIAAVRQSLALHTAQQTGQEGRESKKTVTRIAYGHTRHTYFCPFIVKTRSRVLNLFLFHFRSGKRILDSVFQATPLNFVMILPFFGLN